MKFAIKYEHVSAVEWAPDDSSEGKPTSDVEVKDAIEVTIQFHLKMHMVVHLLVSAITYQWYYDRTTEYHQIKKNSLGFYPYVLNYI